jgi:hypothetical protein
VRTLLFITFTRPITFFPALYFISIKITWNYCLNNAIYNLGELICFRTFKIRLLVMHIQEYFSFFLSDCCSVGSFDWVNNSSLHKWESSYKSFIRTHSSIDLKLGFRFWILYLT